MSALEVLLTPSYDGSLSQLQIDAAAQLAAIIAAGNLMAEALDGYSKYFVESKTIASALAAWKQVNK